MKLSREFKTAIIVIAGIAFFFIGFNFLKSKSVFKRTNTYYAYFQHSNGLKAGTPITVNGVKIGTVEAVELEEKTARIKVTLGCETDFTFSKNSKAEIYSSLLGGAALQILPAFDDAPIAQSNDVLESSVQADMLQSLTSKIDPISLSTNELLLKSNEAMKSVNTMLNEATVNEMKKTIANLNTTMQHLAQSSAMLNQILAKNQANLQNTLQNTNAITTDLAKVSNDLAQADFDKLIAETQSTLKNLNEMLSEAQSGKGSLGKLMKDEALYNNLEASSKQLELLLQDFRLNPKRYVHFSVFGKKAQTYEEPTQNTEN